jgi:hypothetical protein
LKKARAIIQVIEADDGGGLAKSAKRLRAVNRTLSELRDADAKPGATPGHRRITWRLLSVVAERSCAAATAAGRGGF